MEARFKIGDTISNGKVQYTVLGIETNQFGDLCYVFKNPIRDNNFKWGTQEVDRIFELIPNTPNSFDWQSFRAEAAKDILAGMMQHKVLSDSSMTLFVPKEQVVSAAIGLADELIKQLKEKEEK